MSTIEKEGTGVAINMATGGSGKQREPDRAKQPMPTTPTKKQK